MAVRFDFIKDEIRKTGGYQSIAEGVAQGSYPIGVYGISDSARAALISAFHSEHDQSVYVVSHSDLEARQLYEDLLLYDLEVYHLPVRDPVFYNPYAISGDLRWERIKVLKEMTDGRKKIIVTSAEALTLAYMPLEQYKAYTFQFKKGDTIELKTLVNKLIDSGYESVELVEMRGQFAKRGGIIDIFSPVLAFPVRIELFGDEIDSLRAFDPTDQRSVGPVREIASPSSRADARGPSATSSSRHWPHSRALPPSTRGSLTGLAIRTRCCERAIQAELAKIGVKMTIKSYPWKEYREALKQEEGDAFFYGWTGDNGDADIEAMYDAISD